MKYSTDKSKAFREQMQIGKAISEKLHPRMTLREAGEVLGMSYQGVRKLECRALYKVAMRLRQLTNKS